MRARLVEDLHNFDPLVDGIFDIWHEHNKLTGRDAFVQKSQGRHNEYRELKFNFPEGYSDIVKKKIDNFLKDFKLKNFGDFTPFEVEWFENFLLINTIY